MSDFETMIESVIEKKLEKADTNRLDDREEILSAQDAVEYIGGISYGTLLRECRKGTIPCFRIGSRVFIRKKSLISWIEQQEKHAI